MNPTVKEYGYEYDASIDKELYDHTFGECTEEKFQGAYALRSGRDALKVVAREYSSSIALLPSLACDSMVIPFRMYNHKVIFYKLKDNLEIDLEHLSHLIDENKDKVILFLYMDYFGIKSIKKESLINLKSKYSNLFFINDITHIYSSFNQKKEFESDYTIASLRKWINIPDGGLLWCKKPLKNTNFSKDTSFAYKRLEAQQLRYTFLETGNYDLKPMFRGIFSTVSNIIDQDKNPSMMSMYSYKLINNCDFASLFEVRKDNANALINVLRACPDIKVLQPNDKVSNLYVPFVIKNRDKKQDKLNKLGIFNTIIWPLSDEQKSICKNAKYIEEHMLAAPCDQRYTVEDMKYIGQEILRIINE